MKSILYLLALFFVWPLWSQTDSSAWRRAAETPEAQLQRGYRAYHEGNWTQVVQFLSEAAATFSDDDLLYLYLGTAHQILGNDSRAEEALIRGVNLQGENMQKIAFVLGNYYYSIGEYSKAVDAYNLSTWSEKQMVGAFLNRANLYLSQGFYSNALNDYSYFLLRKPFDPQRSKIEAIIQKLMALGAEGRIQADQKMGTAGSEYLYDTGLANDSLSAPSRGLSGSADNSASGARSGSQTDEAGTADSGQSGPESSAQKPPDTSGLEERGYRIPSGDTGNTVGTGGSFQAQMQQLNRVRSSLGELNQNAIILDREDSDIIEQQQSFPDIDE